MAVAISEVALITLAEASAFCGAAADDALQEIVNRATDYCEQWRPYREREYETVRMAAPRGCALWVRGAPINVEESIAITLDGTTQTVWRREADGNPADFDVIARSSVPGQRFCPDHFWRALGWRSYGTVASLLPDPIVVSYTGGLAPDAIPGDLKEAVLLVTQNILRTKKGLTDVGQMSGPAIGQVTFGGQGGGFGREGLSLIPLKAKKILDYYGSA